MKVKLQPNFSIAATMGAQESGHYGEGGVLCDVLVGRFHFQLSRYLIVAYMQCLSSI